MIYQNVVKLVLGGSWEYATIGLHFL